MLRGSERLLRPARLSRSHLITEDQDQEESGSWADPPDPPPGGSQRASGYLTETCFVFVHFDTVALKLTARIPRGDHQCKTRICHVVLHKRSRKLGPYLEAKASSGSALIKI